MEVRALCMNNYITSGLHEFNDLNKKKSCSAVARSGVHHDVSLGTSHQSRITLSMKRSAFWRFTPSNGVIHISALSVYSLSASVDRNLPFSSRE